MKDLNIATLVAVFEEMFGRWLFWGLVTVAIVVTVAYVAVLVRDRRISWRKFLLAQLSMPAGAVLAVWIVMAVTHSRPADIGGPVDIIVVLAIAAAGAIGTAILVYTVQSLLVASMSDERSGRSS